MKNKKVKYLAMLLAFSMAVSPMSYTKAYAENAETAQAAGAVNAGENLADGAGIQEGTYTSGGTALPTIIDPINIDSNVAPIITPV